MLFLALVPAIRFERFSDTTQTVVWEGIETRAELLNALPADWQQKLPQHQDRAIETLSARRALLSLVPQAIHTSFAKDRFGKPFLKDLPEIHFSLSHSHQHAAALISNQPCGVDLQLRVSKITRLRSKFERPDEAKFIRHQPDEPGALHVLWGAKEALFKLYGKRQIDWRKHLIVDPFEHAPGGGKFTGRIVKEDQNLEADLCFRWIGKFCLVVASVPTSSP